MQYVDRPYPAEVQIVSPEAAYMAGKLRTDDVQALRQFERAFPMNPQVVMSTVLALREEYAQRAEITPRDKMDVLFRDILPKCYLARFGGGGWQPVYHFRIAGAGDYTIKVVGNVATGHEGLLGEPTCSVDSDYREFRKVLRYELLEDSGQVTDDQLAAWKDDESLDSELADEQLEAVAGGKGACAGEASAGSSCIADACAGAASSGTQCGAAACAAAAGAGGGCSVAACVADACAVAACQGAACNGAAGGLTACGGAACAWAVGAGTGCGIAGCSADAGVGAACGADAGIGACAGDVCGAAVGIGVCAGNVCGVDILSGADVGPCGVNVIPLVPGC